jgi:hypothetical protein
VNDNEDGGRVFFFVSTFWLYGGQLLQNHAVEFEANEELVISLVDPHEHVHHPHSSSSPDRRTEG